MAGEQLAGAVISDCGSYRYTLQRCFGDGPAILFVMLNPSTADATQDDPTIRRCIGFAKAWGFGTLHVGNLFALRATDPRELRRHADPIGPENDAWLGTMAGRASMIVAAWGAHGALRGRGDAVVQLLQRRGVTCVRHLGLNNDGTPKHPLYLSRATTAQPWALAAASQGRA